MKEQYIKQVEKELSLPRKMKKEVVRDLNEVFASAMEHGETEQQIIQRLGTPKEFADSTAEQFGIDNTKSKKRNGIISTLATLVIAVAAFSVYAAIIPASTGSFCACTSPIPVRHSSNILIQIVHFITDIFYRTRAAALCQWDRAIRAASPLSRSSIPAVTLFHTSLKV